VATVGIRSEVVMRSENGNARPYPRLGKRLLDLALLTPALIVVAPAMAFIALVVRLTNGSPVLFRQTRPGFKAQPFVMYKFRTMTDASDPSGRPLPDSERITRLGAWLRRTSLDELPECGTVLRGEMSLVGPRPLLVDYLDRYSPRQSQRHDVLPGVTGWAQVNGRNATDWGTRLELDAWYAEHVGFRLDLRILRLTILKVIRGEGVSAPGHPTMPDFQGNETIDDCASGGGCAE
jgi:sugar transferase EpsL